MTGRGVVRAGALSAIVALVPGPGTGVGAQQAEHRYEVREFLRLGGLHAGAEEEFTDGQLSLSLAPNDQLFVLDLQARLIHVFGVDGGFVRTVAGPGRGPGEIDGATALGWDRERRLWVMEPFGRRYSVFDSVGAFLHTVPRRRGSVPRLTGRIEADGEGRLVEMSTEGGTSIAVVDPETGEVIEAHAPLLRQDGATDLPLPILLPEAVQLALRHLRDRRVWDWSVDGRTWAAWSHEGRIVELGPEGDTLRVFDHPDRDVRTTAEERSLMDQAHHHLRSGELELAPQVAQSVIRLGSGRLLLQRAEPMNAPGRTFEVFEADGTFAGTVELPLPVTPYASPAVRGDSLFVVGVGQYDVPVVLGLELTDRGVGN